MNADTAPHSLSSNVLLHVYVYQQFVKVQILQHQDATPVEAIGGVLRIGEEFSHFQELLRTWFFTCAYVGTCWFCVFYYILYHLLCQAWASRKDSSHKLDLEEPTCDLDLDDLDDDVFEDCVFDSEQVAEAIHGDQERDSLDHQGENVAAEPVTAYESPSAAFAALTSSSATAIADPPLPNDIFAREAGSDDEWEDLPIDDSVQSDGIQASSPPPTPAANGDSQQTEPSLSRREVSDAELTELLIRRLERDDDSPLREHATNVSAPRGEEAGNGTNEKQRHPFFFFFCW
jgi:hypothetical protein